MRNNVEVRRVLLLGSLLSLVLATVAAGIYFERYFVVTVFAVWICAEGLLWKLSSFWKPSPAVSPVRQSIHRLSGLINLFKKSDPAAESRLQQRISDMTFQVSLSDNERRWMERLKSLIELRGLAFGEAIQGKKVIKQAYVYVAEERERKTQGSRGLSQLEDLTLSEISENASQVARLYWKLFDTASGDFPELSKLAARLFKDLFGVRFEGESSRPLIEAVTDSILRDQGIPFLILNLVREGRLEEARKITQLLLTKDMEMDEEIRSSLYWMVEIYWFVEIHEEPISDFETCIRYLYHLCFTNPERTGFLEIDSQFYTQFETVNELAREGFLFKETLVEQLLILWRDYSGYFDRPFQKVLQTMTQQNSKIYENQQMWEGFWLREQENFGKDYLYVVEGNLCYLAGHNEDACVFYEKALELNPDLRPALLNVLFCYAKMEDLPKHEEHVQRLLKKKALLPSSLYVIGNSFILMGRSRLSDSYYEELKKFSGWKRKADYYRSTFCYENGLYERALEFARLAFDANPHDSSISYHLSLCYNALGEKESALDALKRVRDSLISPTQAQWLKYYQFTLERDAGLHQEASRTLLHIPSDYFQDPDELEEAVEFAKDQKDLALLRHLRRQGGES